MFKPFPAVKLYSLLLLAFFGVVMLYSPHLFMSFRVVMRYSLLLLAFFVVVMLYSPHLFMSFWVVMLYSPLFFCALFLRSCFILRFCLRSFGR